MAKRTCSIDGCDGSHGARGWCPMHYQRWKSNGDPLVVQNVWHYDDEKARRESNAAAKVRWRMANPEKMKAARAAWKKANPEARRRSRREVKKRYPLANRSYVRARRARKKQLSVFPFTAEQLRQRLTVFGDRCWMCGSSENITLDHVKPLSKGGAHMLCNLRPACGDCNSTKGTKWPYDTRIRLLG